LTGGDFRGEERRQRGDDDVRPARHELDRPPPRTATTLRPPCAGSSTA
jgi:hypothetical protein